MRKKCELCGGAARMYCESDQASLCWNCDEKVHGANFLVAKHTRCLLCRACQSPTPWKAAGTRLGPTVSFCRSCVVSNSNDNHQNLSENRIHGFNGCDYDYDEDQFADDDEDDGGAESYDDDEEEDEDEEHGDDDEDDDEDGENQVVPLTAAATGVRPSAVSSSSSSVSGGGGLAAKRRRRNSDPPCLDDEIVCSSPCDTDESRPLKRNYRYEHCECTSRSTAMINSVTRLQREHISDGHDAPSTPVFTRSSISRDQSR